MGDKQIKGNRNGTFSSSLGFVIACVGSAVGLGNIWMFPYRVGQYGGAAFLIPYLLFTFLFGWVGLSGEFAIGRLARTGTIGSYEYCFARRGRKKLGAALSWIPLLGSLGIAIGYAVILGWVLRSLAGSVTGELLTADVEAFFHQASGSFGSVPWHVAIVVLVGLVLMFGVTKGIEKVSKVLMPLFFGLFLILAVWVAFLPGAAEGYKFLFVPEWRALLRVDTWVMAMGQAFFSLNHRLRHDRLRGVFGERGGYPAGLPAHGIVRHTCGAAFRPCDYARRIRLWRGCHPWAVADVHRAADGVPKDAVRQGFCRVLFYFGGIRGDYLADQYV